MIERNNDMEMKKNEYKFEQTDMKNYRSFF